VAALTKPPKGSSEGRPSKSFTLDEATKLIEVARDRRVYAYIMVSMLGGVRTEEARALKWSALDLEAGTVSVIRSVRAGGDTKTRKSRRTLKLPLVVVDALKSHRALQAKDRLIVGKMWEDNDYVFATHVGTIMTDHNVRGQFRRALKAAGVDESQWTPRELRHTFVSLLSDSGMTVEDIARLVGHSTLATTERVYRHNLRPALEHGAEAARDADKLETLIQAWRRSR
jgi:integrase